jgi:hypothetical protein
MTVMLFLVKHKECARLVPKDLTDELKHMHIDFLKWIITGDENWVECTSTTNQVEEQAMKASVVSSWKKIQDVTIGRQVNVDHLGFSRAYS